MGKPVVAIEPERARRELRGGKPRAPVATASDAPAAPIVGARLDPGPKRWAATTAGVKTASASHAFICAEYARVPGPGAIFAAWTRGLLLSSAPNSFFRIMVDVVAQTYGRMAPASRQ